MIEHETEILVLIDAFIHDISSRTVIETSVVVDRLLDIRLLTITAAPV
jgi:hypothetical protein